MRSFTFLLVFIALSGCQSTSPQQNNSTSIEVEKQRAEAKRQVLDYAKADKDYKRLVAKFQSGEALNDDYDAIIKVYPLTPAYNPYGGIEIKQKDLAFEAMDNQDWSSCLAATKAILEVNFTSLTGHFGAMVCHFESGNRELGEYHNQILDGFIDAIWRSGDGLSPASAFYITSTNDLYAFVQMHGFVATGQSLVYHEQRPVDAIELENPDTLEKNTWYFDVTAQFRRGILDDLEAR
ncbi:DUF4919 domain-containing protein [Glaciecola sp. MH2013]|uniref:DUF4919 domain-containing protein n=1 Tax=Glaciecola sp. MH2013 TaxID=2785524 RepID=UPI00189F65EE|nr:DUF4919 domain-containing protein [Glaciecola sp. MH2013]MBF7074541.1 DUF4919 domain-containing protein [Glaciecola sp. MH2013]